MKRKQSTAVLMVLLMSSGALLPAQKPSDTMPPGKNPHLGNKASIQSGLTLYRVRCGDCHGLDARGYRGPDLHGGSRRHAGRAALPDDSQRRAGHRDAAKHGIQDDDVLMLIAYLRDLSGVDSPERPVGNVDNGARLFASQCASCHRVGDRGGRLGPDLSRVGAARSQAALVREIRTPSEWMPPGFEPVTLVLKDGQKIRGAEEERGCVLDSGDGHTRAHPGLPEIEPAGSDLRKDVADAGIRTRPVDRRRA